MKTVRIGILSVLFAMCVGAGLMSVPTTDLVGLFGKVLFEMGPNPLLNIAVAPECTGDRIVLKTGAIAWLEHPRHKGPFPGALVFHGSHPDGSDQKAACILRRALLQAGFVVLTIDHPGYGESPVPSSDGGVGVWDPLPTALAAFKTLRSNPDVGRIIAVGHSMGANDVLRLLSVEKQVAGAVVFGAGLPDGKAQDEYWYERFHRDRRMQRRISRNLVLWIRHRFYDNGHLVQNLPLDHPPIEFVRFGFEHSNIKAKRDRLYEAIPGAKTLWDLSDSTHYFNSIKVGDVIIGDTHVTRLLASRFRLLNAELHARSWGKKELHSQPLSILTPRTEP